MISKDKIVFNIRFGFCRIVLTFSNMSLFIGENETDDDLKITVAHASNKYFHRITVKTCVTSKILK